MKKAIPRWEDLTKEQRESYLGPEEIEMEAQAYDEKRAVVDDTYLAYKAMVYDIIKKAINELNKDDRFIIRHSWGLHKDESGIHEYEKLSSKQIGENLGIPASEVMRRRVNIEIAINRFICNGFKLK